MQLTEQDQKELEDYTRQLKFQEFFARHAGFITGVTLIAMFGGAFYWLVS